MSDLPIYSETDETGDLGIDLVSQKIKKEFSWIFREQPKNDLGIDAHIEIVNDKRQGTGRILAAQIKSGPSFFQNQDDVGFLFYGQQKHLNYWLNHSLPVIIILCDIGNDNCYWVEVTRTNVVKLDKSWKIVVPKVQTLSDECKRDLISIAGTPQHPDIVEMLLPNFLMEKYHKYSPQGKIDICPLMYLPRDFHYFTCLAEIDGYSEFVYIAHHYDIYRDLVAEDVHEFVRWRDSNIRSCGHTGELPYLFIFLISDIKEKLKISPEIQVILDNSDKIEIFRLIYTHSSSMTGGRFYHLTEIDDRDEEIWMY